MTNLGSHFCPLGDNPPKQASSYSVLRTVISKFAFSNLRLVNRGKKCSNRLCSLYIILHELNAHSPLPAVTQMSKRWISATVRIMLVP